MTALSPLFLGPQVKFHFKRPSVQEKNQIIKDMTDETNDTVGAEIEHNPNFIYNPVNMDTKIAKDPDTVLRFCASWLSVPKHATDVIAIFGNNGNGKQTTFNEKTNLPYGFSYKVPYGTDPCIHRRKIENDIQEIDYHSKSTYDNNIFTNYNDFTNYYNDEEFQTNLVPLTYHSDDEENEQKQSVEFDIDEMSDTKKVTYNPFCPDYESDSSCDWASDCEDTDY